MFLFLCVPGTERHGSSRRENTKDLSRVSLIMLMADFVVVFLYSSSGVVFVEEKTAQTTKHYFYKIEISSWVRIEGCKYRKEL